ncbi:MAG: hypothetical protein MSC31_08310 [Solirubrobacteraceae bacterium MAG38_C4-C5]|nr:hypothetical protein [Candidatus Siliceabacter maunaloa]
MRHRIDAGSGLVAVGAAVLLVSLFLDWYQPGLNAWSVFEIVDLALAGLAVAAVVGAAGPPGPGAAMVRWGPLVSLAAFVLVVSQILDLPPDVDGGREAGAWLALAATLAMGVGSALAVASISVTVDVKGRDHAPRPAAVDHRGGEDDEPDEEAGRAQSPVVDRREPAGREGAVADRREGPGEQPVQRRPQPGGDLGTTQAFETLPASREEDEDGSSDSPGHPPAHDPRSPRASREKG